MHKKYINIILAVIFLILEILNTFTPNLMEIFNTPHNNLNVLSNIIRIITMTSFMWILIGLLFDKRIAKLNSFYFILPATIINLFLSREYINVTPINNYELAIYYIDNIYTIILAIYLFMLTKDKKYNLKYFRYLIYSIIIFIPLNIFNPLSVYLSKYSFLNFKLFGFYHILFFFLFILSAIFLYKFLYKKNKEERYLIIFALSLMLFFHLACRFSYCRLHDYQDSYRIYGALPLYVCSFGTMLLPLAVYLRKKTFLNVLFLINMPGAIIVLINPTCGAVNIFSYNVIYFFVNHIGLFIITLMFIFYLDIMPSKKSVMTVGFSLGIYFICIVIINSFIFSYLNIDPNLSFVSKSPIGGNVEKIGTIKFIKASVSILYIFILWLVQYSLSLGTYLIYKVIKNNSKISKKTIA